MTADLHELDPAFGDQAPDEPRRTCSAARPPPPPSAADQQAWTRRPSRGPPGCRNFGGEGSCGSSSGFGESVFPLEPVGDGAQEPPAGWQVVRRRRAGLVPSGSGRGRLPEDRASRSARPGGRRGGRPASCPTICGRPAPAARRSRDGRSGGPCPCRRRGPGRAGGSWAGCRSAASSRTSASTARTAARRRAVPRARAGRRCRAGGSRRAAWSGTWSGSRCSGRSPWIRRARPGRRTWPRTGPHAAAGHRR